MVLNSKVIMSISRGLFLAIVSPLCSAVATVFQKGAVKELGIIAAASFAQIIGGAIVLAFSRTRSKSAHIKVLQQNIALILRVSIIRGILGGLLFVLGLYYTEAIKAVFFTKIEPYFVIFWAWFLKGEKVRPTELGLLAIHILGAFLLSTGGNLGALSFTQLGDLFIVLSMAVSGYSYLDSRELSLRIGALRATGMTSLISGLAIAPLVLVFGPSFDDVFNLTGWLMLSLTVVFFYLIALSAWFESLKFVPGWLVSALRAIGPLAGAPMAFFIFGDSLNYVQLLGGAAVIATSAWMVINHSKSRQ